MYRVDRNNYNEKVKEVQIYTPDVICRGLYDILNPAIVNGSGTNIIFDPCCGSGNLLDPWRDGYCTIGMDVNDGDLETLSLRNINFIQENYLTCDESIFKMDFKPQLVLINPPFNNNLERTGISGRPSIPELFLSRTLELFGNDVPIVLFVPYGFRLNITRDSKRWKRLTDGTYPEISSIISLPKNAFDGVLFHCEILVFNVVGLKPHYFI